MFIDSIFGFLADFSKLLLHFQSLPESASANYFETMKFKNELLDELYCMFNNLDSEKNYQVYILYTFFLVNFLYFKLLINWCKPAFASSFLFSEVDRSSVPSAFQLLQVQCSNSSQLCTRIHPVDCMELFQYNEGLKTTGESFIYRIGLIKLVNFDFTFSQVA